MRHATTALARSITWTGSKQTYYTAHLLVDKPLVNDFCRAYAYFRWADDIVDVSSQSADERVSFIRRQRELIDRLYRNERPNNLTPEEAIIADLISHDREENSGLQSCVLSTTNGATFPPGSKWPGWGSLSPCDTSQVEAFVTLSGLHVERGECLQGKLKNIFSREVLEVSKSLNTKEKYNRIAGIFDYP